jgi:predicted nucleotidyltransferase
VCEYFIDRRNLKKAVPLILAETKEFERIVLFGSFARNEQNADSDTDLCVDGVIAYDTSKREDLTDRLTKELRRNVDVLSRNALKCSVIGSKLAKEIADEGVEIYARQGQPSV